jgi:hypothetical protein
MKEPKHSDPTTLAQTFSKTRGPDTLSHRAAAAPPTLCTNAIVGQSAPNPIRSRGRWWNRCDWKRTDTSWRRSTSFAISQRVLLWGLRGDFPSYSVSWLAVRCRTRRSPSVWSPTTLPLLPSPLSCSHPPRHYAQMPYPCRSLSARSLATVNFLPSPQVPLPCPPLPPTPCYHPRAKGCHASRLHRDQ